MEKKGEIGMVEEGKTGTHEIQFSQGEEQLLTAKKSK